jgi:hypothetical protein
MQRIGGIPVADWALVPAKLAQGLNTHYYYYYYYSKKEHAGLPSLVHNCTDG